MIESLRRLLALVQKEFLSILRDPKSRFVVIVPPLIQFVVFAYAATFDVTHIKYATLDESHTSTSRDLLGRFESNELFDWVASLTSAMEFDEIMDSQKVTLIIHIPENFEQLLESNQGATVQLLADGRNSNVSSIALGYAGEIVSAFNQNLDSNQTETATVVELVDRTWFNPNRLSRWFIVTPLAATIGMIIVLMLSSLSVAREREFGTFDQLMIAPFHTWEILIGKAAPGICFGLLDGLTLALGATLFFEVPFKGTFVALFLTLFVFFVSIVGVGLLISSISMTMQQGLLGAFMFNMLAMVLSGFATSIANMPEWEQRITYVNPLRYAVDALRQIFLQGADTYTIWPQIWPMLIISLCSMSLATWMFRRRSQ